MAGLVLRDLAIGDAGWLIQRHAELYARDEGFDASFEALVAEVLADFIRTRTAPVDRAWIALRDETRIGSIFCVREDGQTARLRLFLVEPAVRGTGLGKHLLETCIGHARAHGFARLVLSTHESHRAACALYAATGFVMTSAVATTSFGVPVVEQSWELAL